MRCNRVRTGRNQVKLPGSSNWPDQHDGRGGWVVIPLRAEDCAVRLGIHKANSDPGPDVPTERSTRMTAPQRYARPPR